MMIAMVFGRVFIHLNEAALIEGLDNPLFWEGETMNGETYDELVALIYECVLDESAWLRLLVRLAEGRSFPTSAPILTTRKLTQTALIRQHG